MVTGHGRGDHRAGSAAEACTLGGKRKWQIHAAAGRDLPAVQKFGDGTGLAALADASQIFPSPNFHIPPACPPKLPRVMCLCSRFI